MLNSPGKIFQLKDKVSVKTFEIDEDLVYRTIRCSDQDSHASEQILTFMRMLAKILTPFCFLFSGNPEYFLTSSFLQTTPVSSGEKVILTQPV